MYFIKNVCVHVCAQTRWVTVRMAISNIIICMFLYTKYEYFCNDYVLLRMNYYLFVGTFHQLFVVSFTMMTERSSETLAALASFLNISNWAANYSFPREVNIRYDSGISCTDRDRMVSHCF